MPEPTERTEWYLHNPSAKMSLAVFTKAGDGTFIVSATLGIAIVLYKVKMSRYKAQVFYGRLRAEGWIRVDGDGTTRYSHDYVYDVYR